MPNSRSFPLVVFSAGLSAALVAVASLALRPARAAGPFQPFTAAVSTSFYDAGDNLRGVKLSLQAVRADGSIATLVQSSNGIPSRGLRVVSDLPHSSRVLIDPLSQSRSTYRWSARSVQAERDPSGGCAYLSGSPSKVILGVTVRPYKKHWTDGATEFDEQGWIAPTLACYALERSYVVSESGRATARTTTLVTSVSPGDPPAALFDVPAAYTERPPSLLMALRAEKLGQPLPPYLSQTGPVLDQAYNSRRLP